MRTVTATRYVTPLRGGRLAAGTDAGHLAARLDDREGFVEEAENARR